MKWTYHHYQNPSMGARIYHFFGHYPEHRRCEQTAAHAYPGSEVAATARLPDCSADVPGHGDQNPVQLRYRQP